MPAETRDPFFRDFFGRIGADTAASFTGEQLDAIKRAFGARTFGAHAVDVRLSVPLGARRYYCVLLMGRERRGAERRWIENRQHPLWTLANGVVITLFFAMLLSAVAALVYVGKRWLGIDVFPGVDMLPDEAIERWLR